MDAHLTLWQDTLRATGRSPRTARSYAAHVRTFLQTLPAGSGPEAITAARIERWRDRLRLKPKSVGLALTAVRSFVRWQLRAGHRADDPTFGVAYPKLSRTLPDRALSAAQLGQLFAALRREDPAWSPGRLRAHRRNALACALMRYAGLRLAEAAALDWADVDLDAGVLTVRGGKGGADRAVPLHCRLWDLLRQAHAERHRRARAVLTRSDGEPMSVKGLAHVFEEGRWVDTLGLDFRFTAHQLRHSFCTGLLRQPGANLFDVQELMGHADPATTRRYYALAAEHLRAVVAGLPCD